MASPVLQTVPLGAQWPTLDPFLFCAHHLDRYPEGDGELAPAASLAGRDIGMDFASIDGWNMYHGSTVPGFPQHPHRGFETITYVRQGWCDHSDSLGAKARFGEGDVQWITAGSGIVHAEMFPLLQTDSPNTLHLFQIWLNLPAVNKMVEPYFSMLWGDSLPKLRPAAGVELTVVAGIGPSTLALVDSDGSADASSAPAAINSTATATPPDSWASVADSDVGIWHLALADGATYNIPPAAGPDTTRVLYIFEGSATGVADQLVGAETGVVLDARTAVALRGGAEGSEALLLQGRPIAEPVARYGPFVMNTQQEIRQAAADYQQTAFGGWPWSSDDPVHGKAAERFAQFGDGRIEHGIGQTPVADDGGNAGSVGPSAGAPVVG